MKKFIVLSMLVAIAALTVGIIRRQEPAPGAVVAASEPTTITTTTTVPAVVHAATQTAAKPAAKKTTQTTGRAVATTTSTTTRPPTTTTTVEAPQVTPTCSTSAGPAAAGSYIGGNTWEDVRISSNMPKTRTRLTVQYPSLKQQFWLATDASGAAKKIFELRDFGTIGLSVDFYDAAENHVGGSPACQSTFMAT